MSKLLIATIINVCMTSGYTKIQKEECVSHFGSCVGNYSSESKAMLECSKKWEKVKDEIK